MSSRFLSAFIPLTFAASCFAETSYFGIQIVDADTGRGVPLAELRTVNDIRSVSDNAGWIAFQEPGLMSGRDVWFHLSAPGYRKDKDGFGNAGVKLKPKSGETATIKIKRSNIAERIGRLTGQGLYRDSELLGKPVPLPNLNPAGVMGQDSVQAVPYRGQLFYLWGDTNLPNYPLGNYRTTSAWAKRDANPEKGIAYDYFTKPGKPDEVRQMMPNDAQGAVWLFGLMALKDAGGKEIMLSHYGRYRGMQSADEQGIAKFDDEKGIFESAAQFDKEEKWRFPRGHAMRATDAKGDYFYFPESFLYTRVKATEADITNVSSYEALRFDEASGQWSWQKNQPPTTQEDEAKLIASGKLSKDKALYQIEDARNPGRMIRLHRGSIQWNEWRKRYILLATQSGGKEDPSALGEIWYAESPTPQGPWRKAVKVVSHPRYTYYNPVHHGFFDAEGGRIIYFEGTYTLEFSGNPMAPARYDYNQLMYRLDLGHPDLKAAQE